MNALAPHPAQEIPPVLLNHERRTLTLFDAAGEKARTSLLDFFTAQIRNQNTRRAYAEAIRQFNDFCQALGVPDITQVQTLHVSAYVEQLLRERSRPTVKQHLAAIRMLLDWLVVRQVIPLNPASVVRGPKHSVKIGKTPVLDAEEARALLASIDISHVVGLRDRALIGLMVYTFARVGAALSMRVEDCYVQGRRLRVRLHEKGGKVNEMWCHHNLETYLHEYIDAAGISADKKGPLFRTTRARSKTLTTQAMTQPDAYRMIDRRVKQAGIHTDVCCHTFRATGINAYLKNGGKLEIAQQMAGHESSRTTGLYDRRNDDVSLDEVERIAI